MNTKTKKQKNISVGNTLYEFQTPQCNDYERGRVWFISMGILMVLAVLWGIFEESISIVLLAILLGGIYTLSHNKKSSIIDVEFTDVGMIWNKKFFQYQVIKTFWIIWNPGSVQNLHIVFTSGIQREIIIPIEGQDIGKIRDVLGYYVPETEGKTERFNDWLIRTFKL